MTTPIGIQLYTVREQLARDYEGTLRAIAAMGCEAFETAGFPGTTPEAARELIGELGIPVVSMHVPPPVGEHEEPVIRTAKDFGCRNLVSTKGPGSFADDAAIRATCEEANRALANAKAHGLRFGLHNHWWEFEERDGQRVYHRMLELLDPEVFWQIDIYWVHAAGLDPAQVIHELGERVLLLHVKDGPAVPGQPMTALGQGVVNLEASLAAAEHAEAFLIELDECATDMMEAVEESFRWMFAHREAHEM